MKAAKKLVSLVLSLAMLFTCASVAFAADLDTPASSEEYITIDECMIAGEKWIMANYPEGTTVSSIVPIKNLDGKLNGYCINFADDNGPAGYLVLNAAKYYDSYIREFAIDGPRIYEQLVSEVPTRGSVENVIYSTDPFEYAVKCSTGGEDLYYNSDSSVFTAEEELSVFGATDFFGASNLAVASVDGNKKDYHDAFFDGDNMSGYTPVTNKTVTGSTSFTPYTMKELRIGTNKNNCGPTAAANICGYYYSRGKTGLYTNDNIYDTYEVLSYLVGFNSSTENSTTFVGSLKIGLSTYVENHSYSISMTSYALNTWSNYKRGFDANELNLILIKGNRLNDNGVWTTEGHFIVGIGYRTMTDGTRFIRVYDGWESSSNRFLNFDAGSDSIISFYGTTIDIS